MWEKPFLESLSRHPPSCCVRFPSGHLLFLWDTTAANVVLFWCSRVCVLIYTLRMRRSSCPVLSPWVVLLRPFPQKLNKHGKIWPAFIFSVWLLSTTDLCYSNMSSFSMAGCPVCCKQSCIGVCVCVGRHSYKSLIFRNAKREVSSDVHVCERSKTKPVSVNVTATEGFPCFLLSSYRKCRHSNCRMHFALLCHKCKCKLTAGLW